MNPNQLLLAGVALVVAAASANPDLSVGAVVAGTALFWLIWTSRLPAVFTYTFAYQWIQTTIILFWADLQGLDYLDVSHRLLRRAAYPEEATWLTLAALVAIAIGVRFGHGRAQTRSATYSIDRGLYRAPIPHLFVSALLAIVAAQLLRRYGGAVAGFSEPARALAVLHWGVYYWFASEVFARQKGKLLLLFVFSIELGIGLLGYFSDFKPVLVMTFLAALANPDMLRRRGMGAVAMICAFAVLMGVVWSSIKGDYRRYVSKGVQGQVILVSTNEQVSELSRLIVDLDADKLAEGFDSLLYRLSYIEYFAATVANVPDNIPFQRGKLWWEAIDHVLVPRFVDPNKKSINDSDRTNEYSGTFVSTGQEGTSISLGYIAETYIDFGPMYMLPPLLLLGFCIGWGYKFLTSGANRNPLIIGSAAALIVDNASVLEQSNIKMTGGLVLGFIVLLIVRRWVGLGLVRAIARPAVVPNHASRLQ